MTLWPWLWSLAYFLKTWTLLITFERWVLELWYFTCVSIVIRPFRGYHYFFSPVIFTLEFYLIFENLNPVQNFSTVSARALIFHMIIPCDMSFPWVSFFLYPVTLHFEFNPLKKLTLLITFGKVSTRTLKFHKSIPCDKTFPCEPYFFTLCPWPWSFTYFLKTFTLLITFEQWELEHWYFT